MAEDHGINARLVSGSVVQMTGLRTADLNGKLGVVKRFDKESGRYEILKSHGTRASVGIKPENITQDSITKPSDPDFAGARRYQHVVFWPRVDSRRASAIPVHAFPDWSPRSKHDFLRRRLGYVNIQSFSGVENRGSAKPDFILYFDAADDVSPINHTAAAIKSNLPGYEIGKVDREYQNKTPRGPCVLVYSPMSSTTFYGGKGMPTTQVASTTSGNTNRRFSLEQLMGTLLFQESEEGRAQYRAHDNPMHRMFGDLM